MTTLLQVQAIVTRLQRARDMAPDNQLVQEVAFRALATAGNIEAAIRTSETDLQKIITQLADLTEVVEAQALAASKP